MSLPLMNLSSGQVENMNHTYVKPQCQQLKIKLSGRTSNLC